jgi:7-keto-8-aminopelargonate synthetase-like enzyme
MIVGGALFAVKQMCCISKTCILASLSGIIGWCSLAVMFGDAKVAQKVSEELFKEGVYVIGFSFPVVPEGQARIRTQMSAGHTREDLDFVVKAFEKVGRGLKIIS